MLRGYKSIAWQDTDSHFYVPSSKNFSAILNYDIPTICVPASLEIVTLIAGVAMLANTLWIAGGLLLAWSIIVPIVLLVSYSNANYMTRKEYNNWLALEKAYAKMSKSDRNRHRQTLTDAFYDDEVAKVAKELFNELGVQQDLTQLERELKEIRDQKAIMKELGN